MCELFDIPNLDGKYKITKCGKVFSVKAKKWLKVSKKTSGYKGLDIRYPLGSRQRVYIHRVLAQIFISNPSLKPQVNHIDGNKLNNALSNLEWVTIGENLQHALDTGLRKVKIPKSDYGNIINMAQTMTHAEIAKKYNVDRSAIGKYLKAMKENGYACN